jgi:hypothetical protein
MQYISIVFSHGFELLRHFACRSKVITLKNTGGELANRTTKIITLSELFSFVSEFSRTSTSDQVTAVAFANHLG